MSNASNIGFEAIGNLKKIKDLLNFQDIVVELFEDSHRQPYISTLLKNPPGKAYFGINREMLHLFESGKNNLRDLYDYSPAFFVEIESEGQQKLFYRADLDIELPYEECRISNTYEDRTSSDIRSQASE